MANDDRSVTILEEKELQSKYTPETNKSTIKDPSCQFETDKRWLNCQYHDIKCASIKKPDEIENEMLDPPINYNENILDRIHGSMIGIALGDALGAHVEFRPREYLREHPVTDLQGGGTWDLNKGEFTDDTSMALCLANSLIAREEFNAYDQLVRYKWWYKHGYMSSTGQCFDIGTATSQSLNQFIDRQKQFSKDNNIPLEQLDFLSDIELLKKFDVYCSKEGVVGNGALVRLTPVPLFYYKNPLQAIELSGISGNITHGDQKAYDACRYYGALIVAALNGETKEKLLDENFYLNHIDWFNEIPLHVDIMKIVEGSFKKEGGYDDGIRDVGYIVSALEAALWAFWSDENSFKIGAIAAVNLGDDTDTTAAIYGQLAGAFYGYKNLPSEWVEQVYAKRFINILSKWITYHAQKPHKEQICSPSITIKNKSQNNDDNIPTSPPTKQTYSIPVTATIRPKNNYHNIPTLSQTSSLNSHTTHKDNSRSNISSTYYDKTSQNKSSHEASSHGYNHTSQSFSNTEFSPVPKLSQTKHTIKTTYAAENTAPNAFYLQGSNSNHLSTSKPFNLDLKKLPHWSTEDVGRWVLSFGGNYAPYIDSFKKDKVDGFRLYRCINDQILIAYGINNEAHRQNILDNIHQLKMQHRNSS